MGEVANYPETEYFTDVHWPLQLSQTNKTNPPQNLSKTNRFLPAGSKSLWEAWFSRTSSCGPGAVWGWCYWLAGCCIPHCSATTPTSLSLVSGWVAEGGTRALAAKHQLNPGALIFRTVFSLHLLLLNLQLKLWEVLITPRANWVLRFLSFKGIKFYVTFSRGWGSGYLCFYKPKSTFLTLLFIHVQRSILNARGLCTFQVGHGCCVLCRAHKSCGLQCQTGSLKSKCQLGFEFSVTEFQMWGGNWDESSFLRVLWSPLCY